MADTSKHGTGSGMPAERIDVEKLAALIDGNLSAPERDRVVKQLVESDEDEDVFLDAAAAASDWRDHTAGSRAEEVLPLRKSGRKWMGAVVGLAAAAAILLIIRIPGKTTSSMIEQSPSEMVATLSNRGALPKDWNYTPWNARRGDEVLADSVAYVRVGVRSAEFELATSAGDTVYRRLAAELDELLSSVPGGSTAGIFFRQIAQGDRSTDMIERARHALAGLPRSDLISLGAFLETARIAAAREDENWFRNSNNHRTLEELGKNERTSPAGRNAAREILVEQSDWVKRQQAVERLLQEW